ncbi:MAG TPA: ATP-binding sensor histidine kinase [Anaerolineae bacterium]|nr:ATP-binding sensor histidine kinase [Anaerolineae bacterium]
MSQIHPDFKTVAVLHEGVDTVVYRGEEVATGERVILKVLKADYPTAEMVAQLEHEYRMAAMLAGEGVVRPLRWVATGARPMVVLEDIDGESLYKYMKGEGVPLSDFWGMAQSLVGALGMLREVGMMHKDIKPHNIIINPKTKVVKLTDFGIATETRMKSGGEEVGSDVGVNRLQGTLAYISPEQTGRMNRQVDYRTDYYSLGVTFYEMLTGGLPFVTDDALRMVHSHMARQAKPPHEVRPEVPVSLSQIVMKLLAKMAEDRYQSAAGLGADLRKAQQLWQGGELLATFPLGEGETKGIWQWPQKLYGREEVLSSLAAAVTKMGRGERGVWLITGAGGMGKSVVVQEVSKFLVGAEGVFIQGKFKQFQRNMPYEPLIEAFEQLLQQVLTERERVVALWRERLRAALGGGAAVLTAVLPTLATLLGEVEPVPDLPPLEAQNRFQLLFKKFVQVWARPERPLALFLDDWQWADRASLQLLTALLSDEQSDHLLLLGSYRAEEVDELHPARRCWQEIEAAGVPVWHEALRPWQVADVAQILSALLGLETEDVADLAEMLQQRAGGNPFFTRTLVRDWYDNGLIWFNRDQNRWAWKRGEIQKVQSTGNVVDLLAGQVEALSELAQNVLAVGACVGSLFEWQTVVALLVAEGAEGEALLAGIQEATEAGFVWPLGTTYRLLDVAEDLELDYRFAHDRIQQAVYEQLEAGERTKWHGRIAAYWLESWSEEEKQAQLFRLVEQVNAGSGEIEGAEMRVVAAKLNWAAGEKARLAAAHHPAWLYFQKGLSFLPANSWEMERALAFDLHRAGAEAAYLNQELAEMERLIEAALAEVAGVGEKVPLYEVQIMAHIFHQEREEAVRVSRAVLAELGMEIPEVVGRGRVILELLKVRRALGKRDVASLVDAPLMSDEREVAAMRILTRAVSAAFFVERNLFAYLALKRVWLSLTAGHTALSALAYNGYAIILIGTLDDIEQGYAFGKLAMALRDKFDMRGMETRLLHLAAGNVLHWHEPMMSSAEMFADVFQSGLETGDFEYGAYAGMAYGLFGFFTKRPLPTLAVEMGQYSQAIGQLEQKTAQTAADQMRQMVANLMGESDETFKLVGDLYNYENRWPQHEGVDDTLVMFGEQFGRMVLGYVFGAYREVLAAGEIAEAYTGDLIGSIWAPLYRMYDSLACLALWGEGSAEERKLWKKRVKANQKKLGKWAGFGAVNYKHMYDFVEAEWARAEGKRLAAGQAYELAGAGAQSGEFRLHEALIWERAALFYEEVGQEKVAQTYWREAYYGYERWGARAKMGSLAEERSWLLERPVMGPRGGSTSLTTSMSLTTSQTTTGSAALFDVNTLVEASAAIFSEIELEAVLSTLLRLMLANTGAKQGALLLADEGELLVRAWATADDEEVLLLEEALEESERVPQTLIQYVGRTKEEVVLAAAKEEGLFKADRYVVGRGVQSVLCVPLVNQQVLVGIVYLENSLAKGMFTEERVGLVGLLGVQAAISITNAQALVARMAQERLQMEKALLAEQTAELERLNADKDRFFTLISHDLRSPFNPVMGMSQFMMLQAEVLTTDDVREMSKQIYDASKQVLNLLESLLSWSRIQMGRMPFAPEKLQVLGVVEEIVSLLQGQAKEKGVVLAPVVSPAFEVYADEAMLGTILRNLVSNALKFTAEGGVVSIEAGQVGDMVEIGVRDTGLGMSPEVQAQLFRLDTQVTMRGTAGEKGTGLGLLMCQELVAQHKGEIGVESEEGVGSRFWFRLPIRGSNL